MIRFGRCWQPHGAQVALLLLLALAWLPVLAATLKGMPPPTGEPPPSFDLAKTGAERAEILIPSGKKDAAKEEANRALVLDFWANFFGSQTDQWRKWLSPDFVNHDPYEPSGGEAFAKFVQQNAANNPRPANAAPRPTPDRLFLMADGDLVFIVYPGNNKEDLTENVHGNIVRVINGKITDWWLVGWFPERAAREAKIEPNNKRGVQPIVNGSAKRP
jgi:predicted SnoaL-like aldol condensation-catalyzing enzyme